MTTTTSSYNSRGELDFDLNEFDTSSISLFPESSTNCTGTGTDGLYGDFSSLPLSADSETGPFFDYSAMTAATDDSLDWMSSPALSISSSSAPWTTSPTFSNDLDLHDANRLNDNAPSPITLTDDTWSTTAQKHNWLPETDDAYACEAADSPRPAKKACTKKASTKSGTASQGRTKAGSRPNSKTTRKPKPRKESTPPRSSTHIPDSPATPAGPSSPEDDVTSTGDRKARHNHNVIEKQYRSRLNAQFERLLAVLPESQRTRDGRAGLRGSAVSDGEDKRMSKAEVLELARRRIYALEQERRDLQAERSRILESVGIVRQAVQQQWVGGVN